MTSLPGIRPPWWRRLMRIYTDDPPIARFLNRLYIGPACWVRNRLKKRIPYREGI